MLIASITESSPFHQLRHQVVRDLAWCCLSPPLLRELPGIDTQILPLSDGDLWPWLQTLDHNPTELLAEITKIKSTRLGIYYETLWRFYFTHSPKWQLLAHNLQISRGNTTLGAFDFLCQYGDGFWHIETAVKFYLCASSDQQSAKTWQQWIGPNSRDRFDLKLARLRDHQLPLNKTTEGRAALHALFPQATQWHSGLCLQGYLFSPAPSEMNTAVFNAPNLYQTRIRPEHSHEHYGSGFWWYLGDFLTSLAKGDLIDHDHHWIILQRAQWFSPVQLNNENLKTATQSLRNQLTQQLHQTKRPLMIAVVKKYHAESDDKKILWREKLRGFVVPDDWPTNSE